jgi:phosphotriesterase-related protein
MTPGSSPDRLRTVTGAVPLSALEGPVLAAEHLQTDLRWPVRLDSDPGRWLDEEARVGAELTALREERGLSVVVDLTVAGMGRNAAALSRLSAGSRVAVVAAAGVPPEPFHPEWVRDADVDRIAQRMLAEIGFGLDGTSILPGVIGGIGTWDGPPTPPEERVVRAAARAALESGLPVATRGPAGLALLEILLGEGLPAGRIAIGQQEPADEAVHRKIAEAGAYVSFGALEGLRPVLELIDAGHGDRLLVSSGVARMTDLKSYGGLGYERAFECGLDAGILRDNPLRWLTGG